MGHCRYGSRRVIEDLGKQSMSAVRIMMPEEIKRQVADFAQRRHISFDKFVTLALMRELAKVPDPELERRASRGRREDFDKVMASVPDVEPEDYDKLN